MIFSHDASRSPDDMVRLLAAIVESSDDAIVGKDLNGIVTSWNSAAQRILGYTAAEMVGRSIRTIIPADRQSEEDLILSQVRAGIRVDHFETWRRRKDGRLVPLSLTVSPIRDGSGRVIGASKIARDISERIEAQEKLARHAEAMTLAVAEARLELERSNEALRRSERLAALGTMAAGLGHDIGNLLLPMRASIDILRATHAGDSVVDDNCAVLARCADYFASLVRGLRLFGRGDAGDRKGDAAELGAWAEDARGLLNNLAGRSVELELKIEPGLPKVALGPGALTQAAVNLVKNAIDAFGASGQFAKDGAKITLHAYPGNGSGGVWFEVTDNGPGMKPEVLAHCMDPYFTTRVRGHQSGTGLGLTLVHRIVNDAGGKTEVLSEVGKGTTVRLWLPLAKEETPKAARPLTADIRLTEGAPSAMVHSVLRAAGFTVNTGELRTASTLWVVEAISTEESNRRGNRPVILMADGPLSNEQERAGICRVGAHPSPTELMRCLDTCSLRRDIEAVGK
ncbi:MAG TPA: PAS domain S-box protein [Phycisphaerales bacterium]|nr:PAS domain S-box protein [Phycisphaerales bacterium]